MSPKRGESDKLATMLSAIGKKQRLESAKLTAGRSSAFFGGRPPKDSISKLENEFDRDIDEQLKALTSGRISIGEARKRDKELTKKLKTLRDLYKGRTGDRS